MATILEKYIDPLPLPKPIAPQETTRGTNRYRVRMVQFQKRLHSHLPPTTLWGYEGDYPGPLFDVFCGKPINVEWINELPVSTSCPSTTRFMELFRRRRM